MGSSPRRTMVLVGTRKGAWILTGDARRDLWRLDGPHMLGNNVNHVLLDPRDGRTLMMATRSGHLGPTIQRSMDLGATWQEATRPPAFPKVEGNGRAVDHTFWLTPGPASQPGVWWAGTSPPGLFVSRDGGDTWDGVEGFNDGLVPRIAAVIGPVPGGAITHSIIIDPRDPSRMYAGISTGGLFTSSDAGRTWSPLNKGVAADFIPEPDPEIGHDPHCVVQHPARPDRFYQQNHCGIYRLDRPSDAWERIGRAMPSEIGDIGFPMVAHPRDPDTAWVFPMDGTTVWPRTSVGGRPAAYRTRDAGRTWERQDRGFPRDQAWLTVKRQAMTADAGDPVGLYLGTTSGQVWMSGDEGASWRTLASHLPEIQSVTAAETAA
ncbi:MAG: WD40/YVTN/BNR-like repeat-containing protein [Candidatus Polarisedimenticolia bacterium]